MGMQRAEGGRERKRKWDNQLLGSCKGTSGSVLGALPGGLLGLLPSVGMGVLPSVAMGLVLTAMMRVSNPLYKVE